MFVFQPLLVNFELSFYQGKIKFHRILPATFHLNWIIALKVQL